MKFQETSILALSPELASVPRRSPETSIVLAEVTRRQREASEEKSGSCPVWEFFAGLGNWPMATPVFSAKISLVHTVNGPLVYQW
jgi:hypothetical protein